MREIKFRAWNGKKMQTIDCIDWGDNIVHNIGKIFRISTGGYSYLENEKRESWGRLSDIKLMQFTGLLDKNGKEIYEWDIVNIHDIIHEIVFSNGGFTVKNTDSKTSVPASNDYLKTFIKDIEIIGNIYENPNLLT